MAVEKVRSVRRAQARPRYETTMGEWVPGVTTILGLRAKPALVEWAFQRGKENPNLSSIREYVDDLAEIGTVAHALINADLLGAKPELDDYAPNVVRAAEIPFQKFLEWKKGKKIEVVGAEMSLVSDLYRYGGQIDLVARIDRSLAILDAKTGKAIYAEYFYQTAAYAKLVEERIGLRPDKLWILQIGRTGAEGFTERIVTDYENYWLAFKALRDLYQVERDIGADAKRVEGVATGNVVDLEAMRKKGVLNPTTQRPHIEMPEKGA